MWACVSASASASASVSVCVCECDRFEEKIAQVRAKEHGANVSVRVMRVVRVRVSVMSVSKWLINIAALLTFNTAGIWWIGLLTWIGGFFVSCLIAAILTRPLVPFFKAFKAGEDDEEAIVGAEAIVVTSNLTEEFGQVRVIRKRGASAQVHCRLADGETPLKKGDTLRVIGRDEDTRFYIGKKI